MFRNICLENIVVVTQGRKVTVLGYCLSDDDEKVK